VRPSVQRGFLDTALGLVYLVPFRCQKCRDRFYRPAFLAGNKPAKAPPAPVVTIAIAPPHSILILDDDAPLRMLFRRLLEKDGYQVYEADSSGSVDMPEAKLDLVITNLDSVRALRLSRPSVKIIVLSDALSRGTPQDEATPGQVAVLEKPLRMHVLRGSVRELLGC
jgi:CheY-like chemotaxis protein